MWKRKESLNLKIATYNIWNSESGMPYRIKYIVNEIKLINADVICLQEVSSRKLAESIAANADYPYWYFDNYPDNEDFRALQVFGIGNAYEGEAKPEDEQPSYIEQFKANAMNVWLALDRAASKIIGR